LSVNSYDKFPSLRAAQASLCKSEWGDNLVGPRVSSDAKREVDKRLTKRLFEGNPRKGEK